MPDPTSNSAASPDTLSPEDIQDLVHAQQHLYSSGDPRAGKLYDYIVSQGYATKDAQGGLVPRGTQPVAPGWGVGSVLSGTDPGHQAFDRAAQTEPIDTSSLGKFASTVGANLGAGATRMLTPLVHPIDTLTGLAKSGAQDLLTSATVASPAAAQMAHQFAQNPSGEAVAAIPQTLMAAIGAGTGAADEAAEGAQNLLAKGASKVNAATQPAQRAIQATVGKVIPSLADGTPEDLLTRAIRPGKNNLNWDDDIKTATPLMKSAEAAMGKPIAGDDAIDDALAASAAAKKMVWQQVQQHLNAAGQAGATIDGNSVADAMMSSIDKRMALQNPALTDQIKALADTYRRPMPVNEAEDFIQSNNRELIGYYAKNKVSQQAATADPMIAAKVAEGNALRDALYSKIDMMAGPGVADLKSSYGALTNVQKELTGRQIVYARQAPVNLGEQMGYLQAGGKILTGNVLGGVKDIAVRQFLSKLNDTNSQIERAFSKADPAAPFSPPQSPQIAGLLPRGAIQTPPPAQAMSPLSPAPPVAATTRAQRLGLLLPQQAGGRMPLPYSPEMTPGEQSVALQHLMRNQRAPLALPARAQPFILPPPS